MTEAWAGFALGTVLLFAGTAWLGRLLGAAAGGRRLVRGPAARAAAGAVAVLAVSLVAAFFGSPGMSLGSVIGAAVATTALGLGLAAAGRPLRGILPLLWRQLPAAMAATGLVWFLTGDGTLTRTNGGVLLGAFGVWAAWSARSVRAMTPDEPSPVGGTLSRPRLVLAGLVVAGGAVLLVGAALDLQALFGLSEWKAGLTLVAVAAAAPTLAAVVRAGWAGDGDAAFATVAFANPTVLLLSLGVVCVVQPFGIRDPAAFRELPALGFSAILFVPVLLSGLRVSRYEGAAWVVAYVGLVAWQLGAFGK